MKHVKNNNCEKKNFFNSNLFLILAISFSVLVIAGTVTYAFYQSNIKGTIDGTIARWDFKANNQVDTFNLDFGKIYPGKVDGPYNIVLSAENSDLDVYYELITNYTPGSSYLRWEGSNKFPFINKSSILVSNSYVGRWGIIKAGETRTMPIYFNWPYDTAEKTVEEIEFPTFKIIARQYTGKVEFLNLLNINYKNGDQHTTSDTTYKEGDNEQYGYPQDALFYFQRLSVDKYGYPNYFIWSTWWEY